jgi:hypothetical protein
LADLSVIYYHIAHGTAAQQIRRSETAVRVPRYRSGGISPHFAERCRERGIDPQDAQYVLRKGIIYDEPELDVHFQEWRYKAEGKPPDSEKRLKVVIAFLERDEMLVITVMLEKRQ